jgi:hypothetical protein
MTSPFDDLIRSTLSEIAEEAIPVNLTQRAVGTARRRRAVTLTLSGVAVAAILVGTPIAVNAGKGGPAQPAGPKPSPSGVQETVTPYVSVVPTPGDTPPTITPSPSAPGGAKGALTPSGSGKPSPTMPPAYPSPSVVPSPSS